MTAAIPRCMISRAPLLTHGKEKNGTLGIERLSKPGPDASQRLEHVRCPGDLKFLQYNAG